MFVLLIIIINVGRGEEKVERIKEKKRDAEKRIEKFRGAGEGERRQGEWPQKRKKRRKYKKFSIVFFFITNISTHISPVSLCVINKRYYIIVY